MKTLSVFNNKGGVGKTTLTFHIGHVLAAMGHPTLFIDLDPQCNLTICGMDTESLHKIWEKEDAFVDDFESARKAASQTDFDNLIQEPRSIHFIVKPTEDGTGELERLPPPVKLANNLGLLPGRLTMHMFEDKISSRWSQVYSGDPQAIRTAAKIRHVAAEYAKQYGYEYVIFDTSPSLSMMNKIIISTTDGFLIPCMPDMFSLYGIRNIGKALQHWKREFETISRLLSDEKRKNFPETFVKFIGYTIYNAKRYANTNEWDLAQGSYGYAKQIPQTIQSYITPELRANISEATLAEPVGGTAIMHGHNTFPGMAQKYHVPIWDVPSAQREPEDVAGVAGQRQAYEATKANYTAFATDLISRMNSLT